uniref:Uncharacterized protein LOC114336716 n=1 Tax=Diabrotica virgifera virgifera TaxID=50390 RepID=A0A6P7G1X2_DIAVI
MRGFCYIMILTFFIQFYDINSLKHKHRSKRYLVYPYGGSFKIVIGIGIPVKLGSKQSMAIGWNLQMQYAVAQNITQLQSYPPMYSGKRSVDFPPDAKSDRVIFYTAFEELFDSEGLNGRQCLLRSICENAMDSLAHEANGLYGKLFNIVLTPNYGDGEVSPDLDPSYLDAQKAGEYGVECQTLYPSCALKDGLLNLFSILDNTLSY